ncbi:hypothetical protein D9M69_526920 [compost metagenome]
MGAASGPVCQALKSRLCDAPALGHPSGPPRLVRAGSHNPCRRATGPLFHATDLSAQRRRARRARPLERQRRLPRERRRGQEEVLRLLHAALPQRQAAHGPRAQLHHQRHAHALPAHERSQRVDAHGLGRLRSAGRKRGAEKRRAAGQVDVRKHRLHEATDAGDGPGHRLEPRGRDLRPELLQMEPVAVPEDAGKRHRLPQDPDRQLGPGGPDRAGQRAGD